MARWPILVRTILIAVAFIPEALAQVGDAEKSKKLTCAQLANTVQEVADYLTAWYSGWYNGLGKKHMMKAAHAKSLEHAVIVHCKTNPGKKVI